MQLTIGSNRSRYTDGSIRLRGKRQIFLEWGPSYSQLLLTMDLYSARGGHIARLWRNQWTFNDDGRFDFATNARGFNLVDTRSGQVVLEGRVAGPDAVVITRGAFYDANGREIEITVEDGEGAGDELAPMPNRSTNPPFAKDEISTIRTALLSSPKRVECPLCRVPLARQRLTGAQSDTVLVSCSVCNRTMVIRFRP